uniref:Uncharacterized protein n=1 Tax=Arundo donax TaxID=35708 RepID=A0A0A8XQ24_ARUDO
MHVSVAAAIAKLPHLSTPRADVRTNNELVLPFATVAPRLAVVQEVVVEPVVTEEEVSGVVLARRAELHLR